MPYYFINVKLFTDKLLKKTDVELSRAWLQGKLLVAFLIEALVAAAERFSPWGYPLSIHQEQMPVERNLSHASPV